MVLVPLNDAKMFSGLITLASSLSKVKMCLCLFRIPPMLANPGLKSQTNGNTLSSDVSLDLGMR